MNLNSPETADESVTEIGVFNNNNKRFLLKRTFSQDSWRYLSRMHTPPHTHKHTRTHPHTRPRTHHHHSPSYDKRQIFTIIHLELWKANLKRYVFKFVWKEERVEIFLSSEGRLFQTDGARNEKERSPAVLRLNVLGSKSFSEDERKGRPGRYTVRVADR